MVLKEGISHFAAKNVQGLLNVTLLGHRGNSVAAETVSSPFATTRGSNTENEDAPREG